MSVEILPYKMGSQSAKQLALNLGIKRLKLEGGRFLPRAGDLIINWGASRVPENWNRHTLGHAGHAWLNQPGAVLMAGNKLNALRRLHEHGVQAIEFTTDIAQAGEWARTGNLVFVRNVLTGHSGRGIIVVSDAEQVPRAPLYTKGILKNREFRVHVVGDNVIDFARKRKMTGATLEERGIEFDTHVRSHDNGWVFARNDVELPEAARNLSIQAIAALGLDFGAVDIIRKKGTEEWYVLEVNTAPGLEGTTLERYTEAIAAEVERRSNDQIITRAAV